MEEDLKVKLIVAMKEDAFEEGIQFASDKLEAEGWEIMVEKLDAAQREVFIELSKAPIENQKYIREAPFVAVVIPIEKKNKDPKLLN